MHWLSIIIIGIAANLDNLGIGVSFGAKSTKIPFTSNLAISLLSMIAAFLSLTAGSIISAYIPSAVANWGGGLLLVLIGLRGLLADRRLKSLKERSGKVLSLLDNPIQADIDGNHILSLKESISLGAALALNCIASGLGAGATGLSPTAATVSIGVLSLITIYLGVRIGLQLSRTWFGKHSNAIGNILLLAIGLYEIFI